MNKITFLCLLHAFFLPVFAAHSESIAMFPQREKAGYRYHHNGLVVSLSLGSLWGQAEELVWFEGDKLSQLTWKIKPAKIIRAEINHDIEPWLSINFRGFTTLNGGKGQMEDYDWMDGPDAHWTHWSYHADTPLNYANEWDISLRGWLLFQQYEDYRAGLIAGYQQNQASWTAYGGSYDYYSGVKVGDFPADTAVAGYRQKYGAPYIGLVGYYATGNAEFNAVVKFSHWARAADYDEHYLRRVSFYNNSDNARFYSLSAGVGYYFTRHARLVLDLTYTNHDAHRADKAIINYGKGTSDYYENYAGMNSENYTLSMGISYLL